MMTFGTLISYLKEIQITCKLRETTREFCSAFFCQKLATLLYQEKKENENLIHNFRFMDLDHVGKMDYFRLPQNNFFLEINYNLEL